MRGREKVRGELKSVRGRQEATVAVDRDRVWKREVWEFERGAASTSSW